MKKFEIIAKTFAGLEPVLVQELSELGYTDARAGRRMVSFQGDKEAIYRANFSLRTALRVLIPIARFRAENPDEVYQHVRSIDWSKWLSLNKTFAVDPVVYSEHFHHSKFVSYRVKDAIVDWFYDHTGRRPNISVANPDIQLHIHIGGRDCTLSLDSSGESLHRRGYRQEQVAAPLNEVLAAGMVLLSGWRGECNFIDPMCGSGTLLIEAALIALGIPPGIFRKHFAFEKWDDFDEQLFNDIYNDEGSEREFHHRVVGYDVDERAVAKALRNIRASGLARYISVGCADFKDFTRPAEKSILITNPPYGERITTSNLYATYSMIGERLKHAFTGNDAWIISHHKECFDHIGLKPSKKIPLYNGGLKCELRQYRLFSGKRNKQ